MGVASTTPLNRSRLEWKPSADTKNISDVEPTVSYKRECKCDGKAGSFFHYFREKLDDAKSVEEFKAQIIALIRQIWLASYAQEMYPCIIIAVRECILACKDTKLPVGPVVQFYNFRLEGKSLPAWIILHAPSDDPSKVSLRHDLLQLFLDEFPLTAAIRDELYSACATMGFNNFFSRVRVESLKQLQAPCSTPENSENMEIGRNLRPPSDRAETITVVPIRSGGFRLKWFVPDMLRRLELGVVGREFVAIGQVWGMYIQTQNSRAGQWKFMLYTLKPSRTEMRAENRDRNVSVSLKISRYDRKIFNRKSVSFPLLSTHADMAMALNLPVEGDVPKDNDPWILASHEVDSCLRSINKDGSCYLRVTVKGWEL